MTETAVTESTPAPAAGVVHSTKADMNALYGIRFFAVFHIFLYHLWNTYDWARSMGNMNVMPSFDQLPDYGVRWMSHGFLSTSFFFMLSGFILAYLYWTPDNQIAGGNKRFWLKRIFRIYPAHIVVILICIYMYTDDQFANKGMTLLKFAIASIANITLMQSWYPPFVPPWNWPAWTLSALMFLYIIMPWLVKELSRLSRNQMIMLLIFSPVLAEVPTIVYARTFPPGLEGDWNYKILVTCLPLFWMSQFMAGMLLSRIFMISRFNDNWHPRSKSFFSWGDVSIAACTAIALMPTIGELDRYYLRHGMMMPLYMIIIYDLARGRGAFAYLFSMRWAVWLSDFSFSIFLWQIFGMSVCWYMAPHPSTGPYQLAIAIALTMALSFMSRYAIEKPAAKWLDKRYLGPKTKSTLSQPVAAPQIS